MANIRSMPKKLKKFSTSDDNGGSAPWSNLNNDLLLLIMMRVGVFDFIAFGGVCKSWRSVAVCNWNKFMVTKQPMRLSISRRLNKKVCYLEEDTRRKLMTSIPHSDGRTYVGITCGYLIFYGEKTCDFWLVNPITRKQLHFPGFPSAKRAFPLDDIKGILVYSPSMGGWVFVVLCDLSREISFSLAGKHARWRNVSTNSSILDLHFFKGKMFMINALNQLYELRLNPEEPTLTLLEMENLPFPNFRHEAFVSSDENLYVMHTVGCVFTVTEVDLDEMKWVNSERTIGEYKCFVSDYFMSNAAIKSDTWAHPWTQYEKLNYCQRWKIHIPSTIKMWYFPHECLNYNDPDMKNGGLLNILKD